MGRRRRHDDKKYNQCLLSLLSGITLDKNVPNALLGGVMNDSRVVLGHDGLFNSVGR
jgi:hypothetical protein